MVEHPRGQLEHHGANTPLLLKQQLGSPCYFLFQRNFKSITSGGKQMEQYANYGCRSYGWKVQSQFIDLIR